MSTNEHLIKWYEEVWNSANEKYIDELMHKDIIVHGLDPVGTTKGIENFKTYYKNFRESFPTIHVKVTSLVYDHDTAALYCHVTAKNANGKEVAFTGISISRMKDGKFIESWNTFDFLKMYQQLGHILVATIEDNPIVKKLDVEG
jgi:predicted ester cyclase